MQPIAVLYQCQPAPPIGGVLKPYKPGGYSDSGADIAFALRNMDLPLLTPVPDPQEDRDLDWVFPDSRQGIEMAYKGGARIFWLNTVLFDEHPIRHFFDRNIELVGQMPDTVEQFDDKVVTNALLNRNGLPVPDHALITKEQIPKPGEMTLEYPLVIKPVRGRGSQGVSRVQDPVELERQTKRLFAQEIYGSVLYAEQFLSGTEITITVMPPGSYEVNGDRIHKSGHWALPPVERFNHVDGIAPYSGVVAVMANSKPVPAEELNSIEFQKITGACEYAAELVEARAPVRIDCRKSDRGDYFIFDLNLKPNMTGPSRNHRKGQDSLSLIAAAQIGWDYPSLLFNILAQRWMT